MTDSNFPSDFVAAQTLWFYADGENEPVGPVSFEELQRLAATGELRAESFVIEEGGTTWRTLGSLNEPLPTPPEPLRTEKMSRQRAAVLIASALGMVGTFLPWLHAPIIGTLVGTQGDGWITFALFLLPLVLSLLGEKTRPLTGWKRWSGTGAAALAAGIAIWKISAVKNSLAPTDDNPFAEALSASVSIGIGLYLILAAGVLIPVLAFILARRPDIQTSTGTSLERIASLLRSNVPKTLQTRRGLLELLKRVASLVQYYAPKVLKRIHGIVSALKVRVGALSARAKMGVVAATFALIVVLTVVVLNSGKPLRGSDGLTLNRSKWRLIKAGARVYADEKAMADVARYLAEKRETPIYRMGLEARAVKMSIVKKAEVLQKPNASDFARIRYFSPVRNRTYDMLVPEADLLPYDEKADKEAQAEDAEKRKNAIIKRQERSKLLGKQVLIAENSPLYTDDEVFWTIIETKATKQDMPKEFPRWVQESRVAMSGKDSGGVVVSIDGPFQKWVQIESHFNGKLTRIWVAESNISLVDPPAYADNRERQPKRFRLGDFSYEIGECETRDQIGSLDASSNASFVVVHYQIENEGNRTRTVAADDFTLRDKKGREFRPSSRALTALIMEDKEGDFILRELQPGIEKEAATAFEIPNDSLQGELVLIVPEKGAMGAKKVEVPIKPY